MTEKGLKFLEEVPANAELKEKIDALAGTENMLEKAVEIARAYGYDLAEEDLAQDVPEAASVKMTDDETAAVNAGIGVCVCPLAGGGGEGGDNEDGWCACAVAGGGEFKRVKNGNKTRKSIGFCRCLFGGAGGADW